MDASAAGHGALTIAAGAAFAASGAALVGAVRGRPGWTRAALALLTAGALAAALATVVLGRALVRLDLSLVYVADAARRSATRPYRLAGLWAGNAGSLLLWTAVLAAVACASGWAVRRRLPELAATHVALASGIVGALAMTSRWAADPFRRLAIPAIDGGGLVPILEHGAMLVHPPLLYSGLALTLAPFALTVAALAHRSLDDAWSALAWAVIVTAMAIGAHWAYDELAWGGFWAWDPVENGVLLPWLALTASLHAARRRRRGTEAALVLTTFALATVGSVLARSGVTASVHAFAEARRVGIALAALAVVVVAVAVAAFVRGAPRGTGPGDRSLLRVNTAGLVAITAIVATGTLAPLVRGAFDDRERVVSAGFYAPLVLPVALVLLVALGWSSARTPRARAWAAGVATATAVAMLLVAHAGPGAVLLAAGAGFAGGGALAGLAQRAGRRSAEVAHLGLALLLAGVAGTATGTDRSVPVESGTVVVVRGYELLVGELVATSRPGRRDVRVPITVRRGGRTVATLTPAWRVAQPSGLALAVADRRSTLLEDLQVVPARVAPPASAVLVVRVRPLARWVWIGAGLMVVGALSALVGRRRSPLAAPIASQPLALGHSGVS